MGRFVLHSLMSATSLVLGTLGAFANEVPPALAPSSPTKLQIEPWHDSSATVSADEVDLDEIRARTGLEIEPVRADRRPGILHEPVVVSNESAARAGLRVGDSVPR